jgi:hypothetical protein
VYSAFSRLAICQPACLGDELLGAALRKAAHVQPVPQFLARIFASRSSSGSTALQVWTLTTLAVLLAEPARSWCPRGAILSVTVVAAGLLAVRMQERSLQVLQQHMRGMWCQQLPPPDAAGILQIVPHLLVALSSPHSPLRASALAAVQTMADSAALSQQATDGSNSAADGGLAAHQLGALLASLASAGAAIMADPDAAVQLLADTLAAAPMPGAPSTASDSGSQRTTARRGSARKAPPPAAHVPAVGWATIYHAAGRRLLQNSPCPWLLRVCLDNTAPSSCNHLRMCAGHCSWPAQRLRRRELRWRGCWVS